MRSVTPEERERLLAAGWQPAELDRVLVDVTFWRQTAAWDHPSPVLLGGGDGNAKLAALRAVLDAASRDDVS